MKKPLVIATVAFALVIGFLVWWFSDAQVIKRKTHALVEAFTIYADDGKASHVSKNQTLAELLDAKFTCTIHLDAYDAEHRRDELISAHLYLGQVCETSQVKVTHMEITSLTDDTATVVGKFSISVREKNGGSHAESSPARLEWGKSGNGQWKLTGLVVEAH